uniref:Uncharacterized protein n=1 Tax=Rhizophagus irregularis (strain DAOM 181602 / DAOM 197198 / MUCL 43194) TaxID=747089 RepID=U9TFH9_RHIID
METFERYSFAKVVTRVNIGNIHTREKLTTDSNNRNKSVDSLELLNYEENCRHQ